MFCAVVNLQIMVGAKEMDTSTPSQGHLMNLFRALSFLGAGFMSQFPSGIFLGLITTAGMTVAQSLALRAPALRRAVGIPPIDSKMQGKLPSFMESIRYAFNDTVILGIFTDIRSFCAGIFRKRSTTSKSRLRRRPGLPSSSREALGGQDSLDQGSKPIVIRPRSVPSAQLVASRIPSWWTVLMLRVPIRHK